MNLFLRLLRVVFHAFFRPTVGILDTAQTFFRVWPHDLDVNLHMTNSRYLSLMDLGRTDMVIRTGMGKLAYKHKWLGIAGAATIRWRKELNIFDKITLETKVLGWDDKWFYVEQRLVSDRIVRSIAIIKVTFYKKKGIVPCQHVVDMVEPGLKSPRLPHTVKLWVELEDEMRNRLKDES